MAGAWSAELVEAVKRFCKTPSWAESQRVVEQSSELLLAPEAFEVLDRFAELNARDPGALHSLRMRRAALQSCIEHGVEATFARLRRRDELHRCVNELRGSDDPQRRAELAREALGLVDRDDDPDQWLQLQYDLGAALSALARAGFSIDRDEARGALRAVLERLTIDEHPEPWAHAHLDLGLLEAPPADGAPGGEPAAAIEHYRHALRVFTLAEHPAEWFTATASLGLAWIHLTTGDQRENRRLGVLQLETARDSGHIDDDDETRLRLESNLSVPYLAQARDDQPERYEQVIDILERALAAGERLFAPARLASFHRHLGNARVERRGGDRTAETTAAIEHYRIARSLLPDTEDGEHADLCMDLHAAHRKLKAYDRAEQALTEAEALARRGAPDRLPHVRRYLGVLLMEAPDEETDDARRARLTRAEEALRDGLSLGGEVAAGHYTADDHPAHAATLRREQGAKHLQLARVLEQNADVEAARESYLAASQLLDRGQDPVSWARVQASLASLLIDRQVETQDDNAAAALACIAAALELVAPAEDPALWRRLILTQGIAWQQLTRGDRTANVESGIAALLLLDPPEVRAADQERWAKAQHNLGRGFTTRLQGSRSDNARRAVTHYRRALEVFTERDFPRDWAMAHHNLGGLFAGVLRDRDAALYHCERALRVRTRETDAYAWARTMMHQAQALALHTDDVEETAADRERAVAGFELALTVFDRQRHTFHWAAAHVHLGAMLGAAQARHHYTLAADAFAAGDFPAQAAEVRGQIATAEFEDARWAEALAGYRAAIAVNQGLFAEATSEAGELTELADAAPLHPSAAYCLVRLGDVGGALEMLERGKARALADALAEERPATRAAEILALAPAGGALVAPLITPRGAMVFIVPGGAGSVDDVRVLELPQLTIAVLRRMLGDWVLSYLASGAVWMTMLDGLPERLWSMLVGPIHAELAALKLAAAAPVVIIPQGGLGLLPLHASRRFMDDYTVSYAPSAGALAACVRRLGERGEPPRTAAIVADPTRDLPHAAAEAAGVRALFPDDDAVLLDHTGARRAPVQAAMLGRSHLHFACHGSYAFDDPKRSALSLAGGESLTIREILDGPRLDARLVVLSGCETGMTDVLRVPDELVGFPGAFLHAGAAAVVSSLWAVSDQSTALLMTAMYRAMFDEQLAPAAALRRAQRWLRDLEVGGQRPFAHPYHWAAFTLTGA